MVRAAWRETGLDDRRQREGVRGMDDYFVVKVESETEVDDDEKEVTSDDFE